MDFENTEFKRLFSLNLYKYLKLNLAEMRFGKDFTSTRRGDLYPVLEKSEDCRESVEHNQYLLCGGSIKRFVCRFFPYATYELSASVFNGEVGFAFRLPHAEAVCSIREAQLHYRCGTRDLSVDLPDWYEKGAAMMVSCRPLAFDFYLEKNGKPEYFWTVEEPSFETSDLYSVFSRGEVALCGSGRVVVRGVRSYLDSGISIADMRPIRYENGEIMQQDGKVYLTVTLRLQERMYQGVISWIPGTAEFDLTGALFYDSGDGRWCADVAASVLYHRGEQKWYLWVCSFLHNHILGHSSFDGDPRFGVNVIDIQLMDPAKETDGMDAFVGFVGDEDPDFFYDASKERWLMAICRKDHVTRKYRYVFFESKEPFKGYRCLGMGLDGAETGGSFVTVDGELCFVCGNDFDAVSDYRIYRGNGMVKAKFDYPDGGFRGWGTLMPIKQGSRTRYYWLTFDRHNASDYNWSYGNIYCFEAMNAKV